MCPAGLEPATYGLEIRCSIQLSYGHKVFDLKRKWSGRPDSNWQPLAPKASALPIAPRPDIDIISKNTNLLLTQLQVLDKNGVNDGDRTRDIRNHNPTLYQLSYIHQVTKFILTSEPDYEFMKDQTITFNVLQRLK